MTDISPYFRRSCWQQIQRSLVRARLFLRFYRIADTRYTIQSSFLYSLYTSVFDQDKEFYAFKAIEKERKRIQSLTIPIAIPVVLADEKGRQEYRSTLSKYIKKETPCQGKCRLLFQLADYFQPDTIVEAGAGPGLTTCYMAAARRKAHIISWEENPVLSNIAIETAHRCGYGNITVVDGTLTSLTRHLTEGNTPLDLIYVSSTIHMSAAALFSLLLPGIHKNTILVVDNIYATHEAWNEWIEITRNPHTSLCLDVYHLGIVFFNDILSKEYKALIPYRLKPWNIGLF